MKIIFSKYAKLELEDAIHFYELEYERLGQRFVEDPAKRENWKLETGNSLFLTARFARVRRVRREELFLCALCVSVVNNDFSFHKVVKNYIVLIPFPDQ